MTKVSLLKCDQYNTELIKKKILKGFANISFDPKQFKNRKVALKPNLLSPTPPEKAVITHPDFFKAIVQIVNNYGGKPVLIESPAIVPLEKVIAKTGYKEIVNSENVEIADNRDTSKLFYEGVKKFKLFEISSSFFDADYIINIPKFKTHGITYITGGVKNFFGTIPGLKKALCHTKANRKDDFSNLLLDLYECLNFGFKKKKQLLNIMDAIVAMEGEGPGPSGKPKKVGAIIIGKDAIAVDYTAIKLVGLDYKKALTVVNGLKRKVGINSVDEIEIIGEKISSFNIDSFAPSMANPENNILSFPFAPVFIKNILLEKPIPDGNKCTLCYQCKKICPAGAIEKYSKGKKKIPVYDYDKCIRCFCCMEICPDAAIYLKNGKLSWLINLR